MHVILERFCTLVELKIFIEVKGGVKEHVVNNRINIKLIKYLFIHIRMLDPANQYYNQQICIASFKNRDILKIHRVLILRIQIHTNLLIFKINQFIQKDTKGELGKDH
jgi:hypothetical protein